MSNKLVFIFIAASLLLLSLALFRSTLATDDWRAFWVTEFHLGVSALALSKLLAAPNSIG